VSFVISQMWPTFMDSRSLRDTTGIPVLGSVTLIPSEGRRRRERRGLIAFLSAFIALMGSFGAGMFALFLLSSRVV
jgi:hypothetical protein